MASAQSTKFEKMVGKPLPSFTMTTTKGQKLTNASLKGKVTLIDFWATWCGPCKAATPTIQKLHTDWGKKGLMVIGADTYENGAKGTAAPYAKQHSYTYTFSENNDKLATSLGIEGIPAFVLVDKKGVIRKVWTGFPGADALYSDITKAAKPLLK
jgi:thiol-disulfide isomerase/thioredoxin